MLDREFERDAFLSLGGIRTGEEAITFLDGYLDGESKVKLKKIRHEMVLVNIANIISVTSPGAVFINSGYEYEKEWIKSRCGYEEDDSVDESSGLSDGESRLRGLMEGKIMMIGFYHRGPAGDESPVPILEISSSAHVMHGADESYRNCFHDFDAEIEKHGQFRMYIHTPGSLCPVHEDHFLFTPAGV